MAEQLRHRSSAGAGGGGTAIGRWSARCPSAPARTSRPRWPSWTPCGGRCRTQEVPLRDGGAIVLPQGRAEPLLVRAYDANGTLVAEQVPGQGLIPVPVP